MGAQGYQESQLNQQAKKPGGRDRGHAGDARDGQGMKSGDITQIEPNIHAGIKYMRWMIDQYYEKEPMTELDKALFAFASYNAGRPPASRSCARRPRKRGLDPNVWFQNVEYVAAEKIGQETITYVSNIYKYYIAYRLIGDALEERRGVRESQER